jgi:hypothetical protein
VSDGRIAGRTLVGHGLSPWRLQAEADGTLTVQALPGVAAELVGHRLVRAAADGDGCAPRRGG